MNRYKKETSSHSGFFILELCISIVLCSIMAFVITTAFAKTHQRVKETRNRLQAVQHALTILTAMKAGEPYSTVCPVHGFSYHVVTQKIEQNSNEYYCDTPYYTVQITEQENKKDIWLITYSK